MQLGVITILLYDDCTDQLPIGGAISRYIVCTGCVYCTVLSSRDQTAFRITCGIAGFL
uniref:Uncharacterized protein n=1 Tax=Anguilla anguilla TaxID=7936 RepID=A0A0E9XFF9_ANGAN